MTAKEINEGEEVATKLTNGCCMHQEKIVIALSISEDGVGGYYCILLLLFFLMILVGFVIIILLGSIISRFFKNIIMTISAIPAAKE